MSSDDRDKTACLIRMITLIVGACAAVLALVAVTVYARKALKAALLVRTSIHTGQLCSCGSFDFSCRSLFPHHLPTIMMLDREV